MGLNHSLKIATDGLVFAIDMGNQHKSWKGEPTTNILPSPAINGRFTTSNGWGSYNANQYNNAQYFSIGTIASVTSNIVTTTTAHPLRTFDAVQPQTTGGGVTAGTVYFVKRISSTQFSLHAYNSTENGSQGYINPSTGFHKVHDSIALDQRISINSTDFPTMWWGPPHVPNSGLVKEVKDGVGPQGQSVMRMHIHRTDNVVDGMAYGVYTPVTAGDVINVSYWMRTSYSGKTILYTTYFGAGISAYSRSDTATSDWVRVSHQWTSPATFTFYQYWFPAASVNVPYWIDICDLQVEVNTQSGDTPFVAGTRSNTQSLLDLMGTSSVTTNSLVYNSNGSFSFNGSTDYITTNYVPVNTGGSISVWFKIDAHKDYNTIFDNAVGANDWEFWVYSTGVARFRSSSDNTDYILDSDTLAINTYYNFVITWSSLEAKLYKNGVLISQDTTPGTKVTPGVMYIGGGNPGNTKMDGDIPIVTCYNRALSANEVKQNFNAIRGRFGL